MRFNGKHEVLLRATQLPWRTNAIEQCILPVALSLLSGIGSDETSHRIPPLLKRAETQSCTIRSTDRMYDVCARARWLRLESRARTCYAFCQRYAFSQNFSELVLVLLLCRCRFVRSHTVWELTSEPRARVVVGWVVETSEMEKRKRPQTYAWYSLATNICLLHQETFSKFSINQLVHKFGRRISFAMLQNWKPF